MRQTNDTGTIHSGNRHLLRAIHHWRIPPAVQSDSVGTIIRTLFPIKKTSKARTVVGRGEESLLCDPGSELRLQEEGREKEWKKYDEWERREIKMMDKYQNSGQPALLNRN